jgi:hypothetical protein
LLFATPYSLFYSPKSHRPVGLHIARHVDAELEHRDDLIELRVSSEVLEYDQDGSSVTARLASGDA